MLDMANMDEYDALMGRVKLTPAERHICDMKYIQDRSMIEIGERLSMSESNVKRIHRQALAKICKMI